MVIELVENNSPGSQTAGLQKSSEFNQYNTNLFKYNIINYDVVAGKLSFLSQFYHQPATKRTKTCPGREAMYTNIPAHTNSLSPNYIHLPNTSVYSSVRTKTPTGLNITFLSGICA